MAQRARKKKTKTKAVPRKANGHHKAAAHGHHKPANSNEPSLSSRPMWQGSLRLSLVSCPVALYGATSRTADISFHLLNPETNNRIRMQTVDAGTGEQVSRSETFAESVCW